MGGRSNRRNASAAQVVIFSVYRRHKTIDMRNKRKSKFVQSIFLTLITNKTLSNPKLSRSQPTENIECVTALLAQYKRLLTNI